MVKKPTPGEWRMTLDFVQLNAATRGLEGWPIPNIQQTLSRLGTLKCKLFGLLDFTAGYHQIPLDPASRAYQLKESGPYFQRSISNTVLTDLIFLEVTDRRLGLRCRRLSLLSHQRQGPCDSILQ